LLPGALSCIIQGSQQGLGFQAVGSQVVIAAPTREVARATLQEAQKLAGEYRLTFSLAIGGKGQHIDAPLGEVVVGTPGRLFDILVRIDSKAFEHVKWLIFDNANSLLRETGMRDDLKKMFDIFE
jgi:superfamily II DNA/RNA helicase